MEILRYIDDTDRSFGAAGMAIGLTVYRGQEMLASISLDREPGHMMEMQPEFYFAGSPELSAKAAWNQLLTNYNLSVAMLISNVLCRTLSARAHQPAAEMRQAMHDVAAEEGREVCQLDDDEIDGMFDQRYDHLSRVFSHYGVRALAHDLATALQQRREMSRFDVLEMLEDLRRM